MAHQPRLLVQAGPTLATLQHLHVNSPDLQDVTSATFEGGVAVKIEDYLGPKDSEGISRPAAGLREHSTWSIVISGRFKEDTTADELMFGNYWDQPIRAHLPYGTSIALNFISTIVDPSLQHDLYADKPVALSPWLATSQFVQVVEHPSTEPLPAHSATTIVPEDLVPLYTAGNHLEEAKALHSDPGRRRKWMAGEAIRKSTAITKHHVITTDFCNGFIDFKTLSLKLPIGFSFPLVKYWDGQPVTFVLRNRAGTKVHFYITFQIVSEIPAAPIEQPQDVAEEKEEEEVVEDKDDLGVD